MPSKMIKKVCDDNKIPYRTLADEIKMEYKVFYSRLYGGTFKRWSNHELFRMQMVFREYGVIFDMKAYYATLPIERLEDMIAYLPLSNGEIAEMMGVSESTVERNRQDGFVLIDQIQKLKKIISDHSLFSIQMNYY